MTKKRLEAKRLKGFQDIHPNTMDLRQNLVHALEKQAKLAGFQHIDTPSLEYATSLLGAGAETDKQLFRFFDNGKRDVGLRFDLTIPFARYVAEHQGQLAFPFKRLQVGHVWRAEKPQRGRYREFMQGDLDIIGVDTKWADMEILSVFYRFFSEDVKEPFTITIGNRTVVSALIKHLLGTTEPKQEEQVLIAIDKLQKIGTKKVCDILHETCQLPHSKSHVLLDAIQDPTQVSQMLQKIEGDNTAQDAYVRLIDTLNHLNKISTTLGSIKLDLSIVRGLGYYTGLVFETTLNNKQDVGSVCSGGRYNQLIDRFSSQSLEGIGGSIGLDRLLVALEDKTQKTQRSQTVFIAIAQETATDYGFQLLQDLRKKRISADMALKTQKLGQQFKYATRIGYAVVITVGEKDKTNQTASIKHLATDTEHKHLRYDEIGTTIQTLLA